MFPIQDHMLYLLDFILYQKEEGTVITPKTPEFCIDSSPSLPDKPLCPDENTSPTLTSSVQNTTLREVSYISI